MGRWLLPGIRGELALVVLCLLLYLPGFFTMPAVDRDEARFVQASRQMLEAPTWHGWIVPRVQERPRLQKPPLIYWLQASSAALCSGRVLGREFAGPDAVWMYRLPSLLAAIGTVVMTCRLARRFYAPPAAILAGALLACSPVVFWEARQGRADMVMLFFTTVAVHALWRCLEAPDRTKPALLGWCGMLWGAVALGVLTKGPVTLLVVGLAVLVFGALGEGRGVARRIRLVPGLLLSLVPVAVWVGLLTREIDLGEYLAGVWRETGGRAGTAMEGHWGPAGYHTLVVFVGMFPACMLVGPAVVRAARRGLRTEGRGWMMVRNLRRHHRGAAFLLAVIVPSWVVFEFTGTKLPHYTLPLYPALAVLSARMVFAAPREARLTRPVLRALLVVFAVGVGAFAVAVWSAAAWMLWRAGDAANAAGLLGFGVLTAVFAVPFCVKCAAARRYGALLGAAMAAFVFSVIPLGWAAGRWPDMRVSTRLAAALRAADPSGERPIAAVAFHEDSLIFETHGRSRRVDEWKLRGWLEQHEGALVVLDAERAPYWPRFVELAAVSGINYSNGKKVDLVVGEFLNFEGGAPR
ncbi:MAG: ArnT family glycosyltransferase [Phycisphaerales bacterium]